MKCGLCDYNTVNKKGYSANSKLAGTVFLPGIKQAYCPSCEEITMSVTEAEKAYKAVRLIEEELIGQLPVSDFLTLNQAADLLGITKQALSKHKRVNRGFIITLDIDAGKKLYYRPSVESFKDTGEGRISLVPKVGQSVYRYDEERESVSAIGAPYQMGVMT